MIDHKPVSTWGARHGMHVTDTHTLADFFAFTVQLNTSACSPGVRGDVLLLQGQDDH